jgi:hypothetical protein
MHRHESRPQKSVPAVPAVSFVPLLATMDRGCMKQMDRECMMHSENCCQQCSGKYLPAISKQKQTNVENQHN